VEFRLDGSLTGLLIAFGVVLGLYGVYLWVVTLSNRATKRLRRTIDDPEKPVTPSRAVSARWAILALIGACGALAFLLWWITHLSR
jgi:amino acid transporter